MKNVNLCRQSKTGNEVPPGAIKGQRRMKRVFAHKYLHLCVRPILSDMFSYEDLGMASGPFTVKLRELCVTK